MKIFMFLAGGVALIWLVIFVRSAIKWKKRWVMLASPFPKKYHLIMKRNIPAYKKMPADLKRQLQDLTRIFIFEKNFEGCGGLELTDEIKVTIAAQACMLLLGRKQECYPKLDSVLVYPSTYVADNRNSLSLPPSDPSVRLGESWNSGAVVLAWDSVKQGALNFRDGHNVAMHEFAHQLDQEDGKADGAPILGMRSAYTAWSQVFTKEYRKLQNSVLKGKKSVLNKYGATNPAEFFAVATETFFEKPKQLKKKHPELYNELQSFYKVNPITWKH